MESFFGGSHREFAKGLVSHSKHRIDLKTMPARFWKWRMRGAALYFVKKCPRSMTITARSEKQEARRLTTGN
ncbi:MAG: DUF3524 domain-containing protein [Deltaproteobacteria bacterium]